MRALILAPPKIVLQTAARDWVDAAGGDAVLFTDLAAKDAVLAHAKGAFAEIHFFQDYAGSGRVETQALDFHRVDPFLNVIALAESDVLRAARLRERWGLGGLSPQDARLFRDKYEMKRRAERHGVPVAGYRLAASALDLLAFIEDYHYPIVVKPVDGKGSAGVQVIADRQALDAYLESPDFTQGRSPLVESFVAGDMYQVNGLYLDGTCVLVSCVQCVHSNLQFLDGEWLGLKMVAPSNPLWPRLCAFGQNLLEQVLPMPRNGLFHIELFHTPDDRLFLCEAACRLAGCLANEQIRQAFDVDIRVEYLKAECGRREPAEDLRYPPRRLVAELNVPPQPGTLTSLPERAPFDWVAVYKAYARVGQTYAKMAYTNGEIASLLITGETEEQLDQRLREAADWFTRATCWA
ncbi:ATP-grasp domain-containing protein [Pseudomonas mangiferae]|uniref:ATP-grasp domain-containing protein n=1 Tax=Pseudomonas mangiferae TaxID=2593654 RepID=A0A553GU94_9PSED|nr:ATP-grasp domain-containing protein [Pseudomonas mangiferae]TRX73006.1 ATP-grasp domain-containing protein [Pseudomonas mangiferae]